MVKRPNKSVLIDALDEYRDAMRPFIVRAMKRIKGKGIKEAYRFMIHFQGVQGGGQTSLKNAYAIMDTMLKVLLTSATFRSLLEGTGDTFSANSLVVI